MGRHVSIGPVDLRVIEAGLDHRRLCVVRHDEMRHAPDRLKAARMGVDPVGEPLRPRRLRVGEARCAENRDKDLRLAHFPSQSIDDNRHAVACVIDEQPFTGDMRSTHRHRQAAFPPLVEFAEPGIAIAAGMALDVFFPDHRQGDVFALHLPMNARPVRLFMAPMALFLAGIGEQPLLQRRVGQRGVERPKQTDRLATAQRQPHRRWRNADPPRDLARRHPARLQSQAIAHKAHGDPLHRHQVPSLAKTKDRNLERPEEALILRAISSRNAGRNHLGMVGE